MGCDCNGKLKGWVKPEDVVKALNYLGFTDVKSYVSEPRKDWLLKEFHDKYPDEPWVMNPSYPKSEYHETISGFIQFKAFDEDRQIHYFYTNECDFSSLYDLPENEGRDKKDFEPEELTSISLGTWGHSSEIMRSILQVLGGGYLDENDCDDTPAYMVVPKCDIRRVDVA